MVLACLTDNEEDDENIGSYAKPRPHIQIELAVLGRNVQRLLMKQHEFKLNLCKLPEKYQEYFHRPFDKMSYSKLLDCVHALPQASISVTKVKPHGNLITLLAPLQEPCRSFQEGPDVCVRRGCQFAHECDLCGAPDHGEAHCSAGSRQALQSYEHCCLRSKCNGLEHKPDYLIEQLIPLAIGPPSCAGSSVPVPVRYQAPEIVKELQDDIVNVSCAMNSMHFSSARERLNPNATSWRCANYTSFSESEPHKQLLPGQENPKQNLTSAQGPQKNPKACSNRFLAGSFDEELASKIPTRADCNQNLKIPEETCLSKHDVKPSSSHYPSTLEPRRWASAVQEKSVDAQFIDKGDDSDDDIFKSPGVSKCQAFMDACGSVGQQPCPSGLYNPETTIPTAAIPLCDRPWFLPYRFEY